MLFNSKGEINASTVQEAIEVLSKYAAVAQDGLPTNYSLSNSMTDEKRDELVARAINTNEGKLALAQAMANPRV